MVSHLAGRTLSPNGRPSASGWQLRSARTRAHALGTLYVRLEAGGDALESKHPLRSVIEISLSPCLPPLYPLSVFSGNVYAHSPSLPGVRCGRAFRREDVRIGTWMAVLMHGRAGRAHPRPTRTRHRSRASEDRADAGLRITRVSLMYDLYCLVR